MPYTNYKKISYVLSEKPGLSGRIAFEFLSKIIASNDVLKFTFYGHGKHNESLDLFMEMYDDIVVLPSKNNEEEFIIKNFDINDRLYEVLCSLGKFPKFLKIEQIDYCWRIEYSDEVFTFVYMDKFMDDLKIALIEQEFLNKGIHYERKKTKTLYLTNKHHV